MLQTDLSIIIIILAAMGFFTMGYLIGRSQKKRVLVHPDELSYYRDLEEQRKNSTRVDTPTDPFYPRDGIRAMDEPSGPILRPTAQELKKMNEDDATRAAKEEMARVFKNEEPIDL